MFILLPGTNPGINLKQNPAATISGMSADCLNRIRQALFDREKISTILRETKTFLQNVI